MAKETKIGLIFITILFVVLAVVVVRHFHRTQGSSKAVAAAKKGKQSSKKSTSKTSKTDPVVVATKTGASTPHSHDDHDHGHGHDSDDRSKYYQNNSDATVYRSGPRYPRLPGHDHDHDHGGSSRITRSTTGGSELGSRYAQQQDPSPNEPGHIGASPHDHDQYSPATLPGVGDYLSQQQQHQRDPIAPQRGYGATQDYDQGNSLAPTGRYAERSEQQQQQRPYYQPAATSRLQNVIRRVAGSRSGSLPTETYTVRPNDTFWKIAEGVYGSGGYFQALWRYNEDQYPYADSLSVGDAVKVPPKSVLERKFPQLCPKSRKQGPSYGTVSATSQSGKRYEVQEGDTLFDIARYELGDPSRWYDIYQLNQEVLTDDLNYLEPGTQLTLPGRRGRFRDKPRDPGEDRVTRQPEVAPRR